MRKQEYIYGNNCFRNNRGLISVSTSSDLCSFLIPEFSVSGASKIFTGTTISSSNVHLIENQDDLINLVFNFNNNIDYDFTYDIYKFNKISNVFYEPSVHKSDVFSNGLSFSGSVLYNSIYDGEFIIKPQFTYNVCTNILNKLGLRNTTNSISSTSNYNLYNSNYDFYFIVLKKPDIPNFSLTASNKVSIGNLMSLTINNSNSRFFSIDDRIAGYKIISLNGLVLSEGLDYSITDNIVELFGDVRYTDIITVYYVLNNDSKNGLSSKIISIDKPIISGEDGLQLDNDAFFNLTYNKFEVYLNNTPANDNDLILTLNGKLLTNKIDYNLSLTNKKRIILEGDLIVGDLISIIYNGNASYVGNIDAGDLNINWVINTLPKEIDGFFNLQLALDKEFNDIISDSVIAYKIGVNQYSNNMIISEAIGTKLFYRVLNTKTLSTLLGEQLETTVSSEIIPIVVQTNTNNNY